ncbi:hypothetical protein EEL30_15755 [Brevibacillus laterosporus]|uniref:Uncharacterized protein n=1 Tax=Brevibacillus laterosporus TaxID=1465 RepID=A0A518V9I5_BRELA|nr:hypothetical protein EEL30_15755 [Brevibacillus laterosporus]
MAEVSIKINVDTSEAISNIHALRSEAERALAAVEQLGGYVPTDGYLAVLHHGEVRLPARGYANHVREVRESQWRELDGKDLRIKVSETDDEVRVFAIEERKVHVVFESDDFKRKLNESF